MKQIICGGFLFIGGCILYSVGTLGFADTMVSAYEMQALMYMGPAFMVAGIIIGIIGMRKKD
ncbi:MAG: hypothetical protein LBC82_01945 [Oscillospiraceae bacterium]|jgi:hypothetical protein|nr:hypothetical protein [Oscillospiraceae bacterium]